MSAQDKLSREQFGSELGNESSPPEQVRVSELWRHREYDLSDPTPYAPGMPMRSVKSMHTWDNEKYGDRSTEEDWGKLRESVKAEGIKNPIQFKYDPKTHYGFIGEGNHRLQVAHELGMETVPVVGTRGNYIDDRENPDWALPDPHLDTTEHFPDRFRVSRVLPKRYMGNG